MVLEALAAVSLANSIVQFVDFSSSLVAGSWKLSQSTSGLSARNEGLQIITEHLESLSQSLLVLPDTASEADKAITKLATLCNAEAKELLSVVEGLKAKGSSARNRPYRAWQSFSHALKSQWKENRIKDFQSRLSGFQSQLILHLVALTR